jgi:hypothetical protein
LHSDALHYRWFAFGVITLSVPIFRPESSRGEPQQWGLSQRAVYVPASQWPYYGRYILGRDTMPVLHSRGSVIGRRRAPACLNPSDTTARITLAMPVNVAHGKLWLYKPLLYLLTRSDDQYKWRPGDSEKGWLACGLLPYGRAEWKCLSVLLRAYQLQMGKV